MAQTDFEVIIAGGGPVGTALAIDLAQRGIKVLVLERHAQPQPIPKGQNLTQRTMESFMAWGCEKELRAARPIPADIGMGGMTLYKNLLTEYHYDWLNRASVNAYYATGNERLPQYETEKVLRARAAQLETITFRYGWSVERVSDEGDYAQVVASTLDGTARDTLTAHYVVGCDGSRSPTRTTGGIPQAFSDHGRLMVLLVFKSMELHELLKRYPGKAFFNVLTPELEGYWQFFGRVDVGSWFFHAPVPRGTTEDHDFTSLLHEVVGTPFDLEMQHVGFWDLRVAIATSYRNGRIFVAGDAAHSHPPYGGYGINTGFEDARNLGWKLAAVLQGWAAAPLLDSYDLERRPVFASTARDFIERFIDEDNRFMQEFDPQKDKERFEKAWFARNAAAAEVANFEPNYEGSPLVADTHGQPSAQGSHSLQARAGHHLPPLELAQGRQLWSELSAGYTLLSSGAAHEGTEALRQAAADLTMPLKVVEDPAVAAYGADLILVRPDHFVAWMGGDGRNAPEILAVTLGG